MSRNRQNILEEDEGRKKFLQRLQHCKAVGHFPRYPYGPHYGKRLFQIAFLLIFCLILTACRQEAAIAPLTEVPTGTPLYGLEDGNPAELESGTSSFNSGELVSQKDGGNTIHVWYQNTNDAEVSVILYRYGGSYFNQDDTEKVFTFQVASGEHAGMSCSGNSVAGETYLVRIEVYESGIGERRSSEISGALLVTQSE